MAIFDSFWWLYTTHAPLEDFRAGIVRALPGVEIESVPRGDGHLNLDRLSLCS